MSVGSFLLSCIGSEHNNIQDVCSPYHTVECVCHTFRSFPSNAYPKHQPTNLQCFGLPSFFDPLLISSIKISFPNLFFSCFPSASPPVLTPPFQPLKTTKPPNPKPIHLCGFANQPGQRDDGQKVESEDLKAPVDRAPRGICRSTTPHRFGAHGSHKKKQERYKNSMGPKHAKTGKDLLVFFPT